MQVDLCDQILPRRYGVTGRRLSRAHAIACSGERGFSLSQLALLLTAVMLLLAGCGKKDNGGNGGLDPVEPGSVAITIVGLPAGGEGALTLTGPAGFSRVVTADLTLTGLVPGTYTLTAADVVASGDGYHGLPETQTVLVRQRATASATVTYAAVTGRLAVAVGGLPAGGAQIQVQGPNGFTRVVTRTDTLATLAPGNYILTAASTTVDGDRFAPLQADQLLSVTAGAVAGPASFEYQLASGRLSVVLSQVPDGAAPNVNVSGPKGFAAQIASDTVLKGLDAGTYTLAAPTVVSDGHTYQPTYAPGTSVLVSAMPVAASSAVSYTIATGVLTVTVAGLPGGVNGNVTVMGPGGFNHGLVATGTLIGLAPGSYTVAAGNVSVGATLYTPSASSQSVAVSASLTPSNRTVTYSVAAGNLAVSVVGLPGGVSGAVTVTGPGGFNRAVPTSQTLSGLAPGTYTITAAAVSSGGQTYNPSPTSQTKAVTTGTTATASVAYAGSLGNLTVTVNGLPGGLNSNVTVTGPGGFTRAVTATTTITGMNPGSYTVTAANVSSGGQTYAGTPASQSAAVSAGTTSSATVSYAPTLGGLAITVSGLPGGVNGNVTVTGPGGFNQNLTATQTLNGLTPGTYTITAANVVSGPTTYAGAPLSQTAAVTAGATASRTVTYAPTGSLAITVTGLPGGALAAIVVTGPGGYTQAVTGTTTLNGLGAGSYTITGGNVSSGGSTYAPAPVSQSATVTGGATVNASVVYSVVTGVTLNLSIDGMYLTQAAAKYDGTTPVITGRDAYLRVFVKANQANTATPSVRVRLYSGAALVQTSTITAPGASAPTTVSEAALANSWNLAVPAGLVQPNLRILTDVDPSNAIAETDDADNTFPVSGTPFSVDVKTVPTWNIRFVPVLQQVNGLQGNVTAGNMAQFLADPLKMLPVAGYAADVRAAYTTTAPALESGNGNGAWGTILNEVWALRTADASNRYYYGVVKTSYGGGVAGIGYVGSGINVSLGWDHLPSGSGVMAHEVGHNMGRPHSPCGGASGPDPAYPYAGGQIGIYGLDVATLSVKQPTTNFDFMGYCSPDWVSDYTWGKMITYRQSNPNYAPPTTPLPNAAAGLLVWGRLTHDGVVLEPAFRVAPPTSAPTGTGAYRIEGRSADGTVLFRYPVNPVHTMTAVVPTGHDQHFAAVLPLSAAHDRDLVSLRLVTPEGVIDRRTAALPRPDRQLFVGPANAILTRPNPVQATLRWDGATYPMAMVRDRATGQILSFARGGNATIWTGTRDLDITFSDGVRSINEQPR